MKLRPYQSELVARVGAAFRSGTRTAVMQLGTGGGKTATVAELIAAVTACGKRTVFAAHLDSLVGDTHARLTRAGVRAGFVQAGRPTDAEALVQVASLQTMHVRGTLPPADFFVLDECHRAMSETVKAILDAYPRAWILGLTATPQRGDGKPLGPVFEKLIEGPSNRWLAANGFLVPCELLAPASFLEQELADDPVAAYSRSTPNRRAIVFAASVAHARLLVDAFNAAGFPAGLIVGETPREEREQLRARVVSGELVVLVGVDVFVEGFDCPPIEVVVLARPFSVTGAFLQSIGRGLRPSPETGKIACTVLDLRGSVHLHGLPDEERKWSLGGNACVRTEKLEALQRCKACLAVYRPRRSCPRCGATAEAIERIPRVLKRAEKLERFDELTQAHRDRLYLRQLTRVALTRMRMPEHRATEWARRRFKKKFNREPEAA